eukprot:gene28596-51848_t
MAEADSYFWAALTLDALVEKLQIDPPGRRRKVAEGMMDELGKRGRRELSKLSGKEVFCDFPRAVADSSGEWDAVPAIGRAFDALRRAGARLRRAVCGRRSPLR